MTVPPFSGSEAASLLLARPFQRLSTDRGGAASDNTTEGGGRRGDIDRCKANATFHFSPPEHTRTPARFRRTRRRGKSKEHLLKNLVAANVKKYADESRTRYENSLTYVRLLLSPSATQHRQAPDRSPASRADADKISRFLTVRRSAFPRSYAVAL